MKEMPNSQTIYDRYDFGKEGLKIKASEIL